MPPSIASLAASRSDCDGRRETRGFDAIEVLGRHVAGHVVAVEARRLEFLQRRVDVAHRLLQRFDVLIHEVIRADHARDFFVRAAVRDEFAARRHVDAVHVREFHRRRRRRENHLVRARIARHLHDFVRGRAAHDRIVDDQHVLALELDAHRVQLLAHRLLAHRLARHDEGAAHVAVLEEAFAIFDAQLLRDLHRGRTRRIGNRHHDVDRDVGQLALDLLGEVIAHAQTHVVDRHAVEHRVRTREIHEFENARVQARVRRALLRCRLPSMSMKIASPGSTSRTNSKPMPSIATDSDASIHSTPFAVSSLPSTAGGCRTGRGSRAGHNRRSATRSRTNPAPGDARPTRP